MNGNVQKIASRYARALLTALKSEGATMSDLSEASESFIRFSEIWSSNDELRDFILNPLFSRATRESLLMDVLAKAGFPSLLLSLLKLLFSRDRLTTESVPAIAQAFKKVVDNETRTVRVDIEIATPVSDEEKQSIQSRVSGVVDGKPLFNWRLNPSILGGIVIRYEGKVLDGSVLGRIERVEHSLLGY